MIWNRKIGTRLGVGFFTLLLLLLAAAVFGINRMHTLYGLISKMHVHPFTVTRAVSRIDANMINIYQRMGSIVHARDLSDVDKYSLDIDETEKKIYEDLDIISRHFLGDKEMCITASSLYSQLKPVRDEVISLLKAGKRYEAEDILHGRYDDHVEAFEKVTSAITEFAQNKAGTFLYDAENITKDALVLMWVFLPIATIISMLIAYLLTRSITSPLSTLNQAAIEIGKHGPYTTIDVTSDDEIGQLASSFRTMTKDLKEHREMLKQTNSILSSTVESTADGILVVDTEGCVTFYNQRFAEMWHIPQSLLTTRDDEQLLSCVLAQLSDPEGFLADVKELYTTPERKSFDVLNFKDGRVFERYSQPQTIEGNVVGRVWSFRDVTRRREIEKSLMRELSINKAMSEISSELIKPLSITTIADTISQYARELTTSKYANASYIDQFTDHLIATAVSKEVWDQCRVGNQSLVFREFKGLWGWVLKNKKPLMTNTPTEDPRYEGIPEGHVVIERFLSVPAMIDGTVVGQVSVINPDRDYTEADLKVAERLAALFALAINRSRIEDTINRELNFQSSVARITEVLLDPRLDKYDISKVLHEEALSLTGSSHGYVSIIDEVTGDNIAVNLTDMMEVECKIARENQRISFPRSPEGYSALWGHSLNTREGFYTNSPAEHPAFKGCIPEGHVLLQRFLSVPAISGERLVGQISLANPVRDYNDKDLEMITRLAVIYSIAIERKTMEEQLYALNVNLAQRVDEETARRQQHEQLLIQQSKMAAMGEMIGLIAHQWKQPLNAISLITQDIGDAYLYNELNIDYLKETETKILKQIQFMAQTIDSFRNFLKPSKEKVAFDVKTAIEEIVSMLSPLLIKSNVKLNLDYAGNGVNTNATGYQNEFKQVILNLINNARDALISKSSGEPKTEKAIQIDILEESAKTVVSIRDNGGGIPDDIIGRIFEPYFTTKSSEQGTGIGLYMAKTIIETNMGWKLTARNIDNGAEFRIEI
ncbi:multi-sensor signal transduction histidine kinase [Candidatus Magnetobacterium bavaricum]|uniref:histidine kinase n=1 Tax=Candidatus Magnetobacterium bavaricum TaxID=29290 RepID=A0A0F3GUX7_9BACT|nr:multi-sensor signal transduction histidine kinase [Candidatus Magnetobacterium bavaricum]